MILFDVDVFNMTALVHRRILGLNSIHLTKLHAILFFNFLPENFQISWNVQQILILQKFGLQTEGRYWVRSICDHISIQKHKGKSPSQQLQGKANSCGCGLSTSCNKRQWSACWRYTFVIMYGSTCFFQSWCKHTGSQRAWWSWGPILLKHTTD